MNKKDRKTPLCKTKSTQKIAEEASGASNTALPQEKKKTTKRQDPISDIDIDKKIINPLS
jgi:hypothetical protein